MERGFPFGEPEKLLHTKRKLLERLKLFYREVILQRISLGKGVGAFLEGKRNMEWLVREFFVEGFFGDCVLLLDRC